jgi:hypothetical protein
MEQWLIPRQRNSPPEDSESMSSFPVKYRVTFVEKYLRKIRLPLLAMDTMLYAPIAAIAPCLAYKKEFFVETRHDDISDPATPAAVVSAIEADTLDLAKLKDLCLVYVHEAMESLTDDARLLLARLSAPPVFHEHATFTARSPGGYVVTLATTKATAAEMLDAIGAMGAWCAANGYTPV